MPDCSPTSPPPADVGVYLRDGRPDWNTIDFELACPRCGYNLRGLTRARCPECGLDVDWERLLDQHRRRTSFQFEHAGPSAGEICSAWLRTIAATFRPARFWRRMSLYDEVRPRRLIAFMLGAVAASLVLLHGSAAVVAQVGMTIVRSPAPAARSWWYYFNYPVLSQFNRLASWPWSGDRRYLNLPIGLALGLIGAAGLLLVLNQTLNRMKVRRIHILRVTAYTAPPVAVWFVVSILLMMIVVTPRVWVRMPLLPRESFSDPALLWRQLVVLGLVVAGVVVMGAYLSIALDRYLHLPRPWFVGMTTAVADALFVYTLLLVAEIWLIAG